MQYMNSIQMVWTIIAFSVFIGVVIWAWSSKRKDDFNEAANLIFDENDMAPSNLDKQSNTSDKHHV